jgi:hypothetical protein
MNQWAGVPRACELKGPRSRQRRSIDWVVLNVQLNWMNFTG